MTSHHCAHRSCVAQYEKCECIWEFSDGTPTETHTACENGPTYVGFWILFCCLGCCGAGAVAMWHHQKRQKERAAAAAAVAVQEQAPAVAPAYGQEYGQPAYGQPAYGQPAYGQPAYGQQGYPAPPAYDSHASGAMSPGSYQPPTNGGGVYPPPPPPGEPGMGQTAI